VGSAKSAAENAKCRNYHWHGQTIKNTKSGNSVFYPVTPMKTNLHFA
jgi:hypothetical protein